MSFPLEIAKLCLEENCRMVFASGGDVCVKCGSKQWTWLKPFIKGLEEAHEKANHITGANCPHGN
jgi:hypothetical protein